MKGNEMKWTERKRKQKHPKIQSKIPNTFSNTESIAKEESLHNQLKKINHYPSTVEGGGFINQFPTLYYIYVMIVENVL